ncbi:hypothetical protein [Nostoc sp. 'Peltigera membranacea cyanobiont' 232]|uniref:hypothetical protein n=1 Tax=Nostoc sp. 'Peltigera membranacea cyanobiont' 232 TaxID=2014531 RepID=UPI000B959477|nr:hypothetical protein [Nostoc sp. 'Peltigera membranacea cyanobiont' 232]OYE01435.1 hypothetical protein CDG79_29555 [Nostoc sp. 'Peltigera membranacea cyanobiont' 232]
MGTALQFIFPDGSQISVELCGIDALEVKKGKIPGQPLSDQAKEKSAKALAQSCGCLGCQEIASRGSNAKKSDPREIGCS